MSERYYRGIYTSQALCDEMGINRNNLADLVKANLLKYVKVGNHKVFTAKDVNEMLDRYAGFDLSNYDRMVQARAIVESTKK